MNENPALEYPNNFHDTEAACSRLSARSKADLIDGIIEELFIYAARK
ncbi:hypothetical protein CHISP_1010 [Chitinispirillum alkaliphilum]|nr:hypothetical protein CHISP_1010 [Chitinispirillum alkaliphilum]